MSLASLAPDFIDIAPIPTDELGFGTVHELL